MWRLFTVLKSCMNCHCKINNYFLILGFVSFTLPWHLPFFQELFSCWHWGLNPWPWMWDADTRAPRYTLSVSQDYLEEDSNFILRRTCTVVPWCLKKIGRGRSTKSMDAQVTIHNVTAFLYNSYSLSQLHITYTIECKANCCVLFFKVLGQRKMSVHVFQTIFTSG